MIEVLNDGQKIIDTNYCNSEYAKKGYVVLSINDGCFRLLVPTGRGVPIDDIKTGKVALVTRGPWTDMGGRDAIELLFEDYTDSPFVLHIVTEQVDRLPLDRDRDRPGQPPRWKFALYTEEGKVFECPARYRKAKSLPCLKKWRDDV